MAPHHSKRMKATMKRTTVCAILGMSSLCLTPAPSLAIIGNWSVVVVEKERPVPGATVSVAFPDGTVADTKKTDARGEAVMRVDKPRSYGVTVKTPAGQTRVVQVAVPLAQKTTTIDVGVASSRDVGVASSRDVGVAARSRIDPYVALFGGVNSPGSFTNVKGIEDNAGISDSDVALKVSAVVGAKLGLFLQQPTSEHRWPEWIGGEIDLSYSNPHVKAQTVRTGGTFTSGPNAGVTVPPTDLPIAGAHVRVMTAAMHALVRYPGQYLQPYIGGGPAMFWGRIANIDLGGAAPGTASDVSLGYQVVGGLRALLPGDTVRWFGFLEGRYQHVSFDVGGNSHDANKDVFLSADYAPIEVIAGVGLHF
jgi:hypothetical protein